MSEMDPPKPKQAIQEMLGEETDETSAPPQAHPLLVAQLHWRYRKTSEAYYVTDE